MSDGARILARDPVSGAWRLFDDRDRATAQGFAPVGALREPSVHGYNRHARRAMAALRRRARP